jgi:HAE1 family hydrophobic/amphiphilic exporter-1
MAKRRPFDMAMSIMVSMLVAFTLTPTLSARLLKRTGKGHGDSGEGHHPFYDRIYLSMLRWALGHRWAVVL